jgi:uncharacterized membrane protein
MPEHLFTKTDREKIIASIQAAERETSGEIQVHIENDCGKSVLDRATEVFETLKMHQTQQRNAVLFYLAVEAHQFAVLGDSGINKVVQENFWEQIKEQMLEDFKQSKFTDGLCKGIEVCGRELKTHFPYNGKGDINELPDEISFS